MISQVSHPVLVGKDFCNIRLEENPDASTACAVDNVSNILCRGDPTEGSVPDCVSGVGHLPPLPTSYLYIGPSVEKNFFTCVKKIGTMVDVG
jgi:hypothetical protein